MAAEGYNLGRVIYISFKVHALISYIISIIISIISIICILKKMCNDIFSK